MFQVINFTNYEQLFVIIFMSNFKTTTLPFIYKAGKKTKRKKNPIMSPYTKGPYSALGIN